MASAVALVAAIAVAGFLFARRALFLARLVRSGKPSNRVSDVPRRVGNETTIVLGQKKLLQRLVPGLVHAFIFWGFLVLFPTIFMAVAATVDHSAEKQPRFVDAGRSRTHVPLTSPFVSSKSPGCTTFVRIASGDEHSSARADAIDALRECGVTAGKTNGLP